MSLLAELNRFNPESVPAAYALAREIEQGGPSPSTVADMLFTLDSLESAYPQHAGTYQRLQNEIWERYGALVDSDAPAGPPDTEMDGGMIFSMSTCDHQELPPLDQEEIEEAAQVATQTGEEIDLGELTEMLNQELLIRDRGIMPPWARYPETFNLRDAPPTEMRGTVTPIDFRQEARLLAANPRSRSKAVSRYFSAEAEALAPSYLIGDNAKLAKQDGTCWLGGGVALAPHTTSELGPNLCPYATKGCAAGCLNLSGRAKVYKGVLPGRLKRTKLLFSHRPAFMAMLEDDFKKWQRKAARGGPNCAEYKLAIRMNILSDLEWEYWALPWPELDMERMSVVKRYPDIQFYDYTKIPSRMERFLSGNWPDNYHLTFSWSELNAEFAFNVLDQGGSVAVAFDHTSKKDMPTEYCGYPVINADLTDFRFLDREMFDIPKGVGFFCGLKMKMTPKLADYYDHKEEERAKGLPIGSRTGGFFQYADLVPESNAHPGEFKAKLIAAARQRQHEQQQEGFQPGVPKSWM